ncbi:MAG: serine/threonine protein kinase, partial [Deltaproteobacteria bacterium]|nr:serine/threonine protein kinase [Deltaproteobacteria bacterium]
MADPAPHNFGRYLLRERVGRGGMAEVFRASLPGFGGFDKVVAIKRMFREFGHDPGFVQMLTDEAKIVSQLAHPNIVQILDVGRLGDDYFMAFEFVEGVDLFAVLQRHHETEADLPIELACFAVAELCAALDHAHSRRNPTGESLGIVHRDVSPQNVLLSYLGEVKLTDFGIAKAAHRFTQTQAGLVKGKVYYMAPEQVLGHAIDHRADLFAAGILLYETLVTQPLYDELDQQKLLDVVSRAHFRWPTDKVQRVPPALRAVVDRALRLRADERYQSGREMRAAILGAVRELGLAAERDDLGTYLRAMYGMQPDRPPTVVAASRTHHHDRDERWNSRIDVRPPPVPDPADGPTYRDPALPPKLPGARPQPPARAEPIVRPAASTAATA